MGRSLKPLGPGTATFSPCEKWRYELTRDLTNYPRPVEMHPPRGVLLSIGLNPSTATCDDDDPTIHKESLYTIMWGYAIYIKANAYGYRATVPADMFAARDRGGIDIVGPGNDAAIRAAVARVRREGGRVLAAWGGNIEPDRQRAVARLLANVEVVCVRRNNDGTPMHPLYARNAVVPVLWTCP
jgi:hypothetical protein